MAAAPFALEDPSAVTQANNARICAAINDLYKRLKAAEARATAAEILAEERSQDLEKATKLSAARYQMLDARLADAEKLLSVVQDVKAQMHASALRSQADKDALSQLEAREQNHYEGNQRSIGDAFVAIKNLQSMTTALDRRLDPSSPLHSSSDYLASSHRGGGTAAGVGANSFAALVTRVA